MLRFPRIDVLKLINYRTATFTKNSDIPAVDAEVKRIRSSLDKAMSGSKYSFITLWRRFVNRPEVYKPFGIIILLNFVQQFSGLSILRAYAVEVFDTVFTKADPENSFGQGNGTNCTFAGEEFGATSNNAYISAIVVGTTRLLGRNFRRITLNINHLFQVNRKAFILNNILHRCKPSSGLATPLPTFKKNSPTTSLLHLHYPQYFGTMHVCRLSFGHNKLNTARQHCLHCTSMVIIGRCLPVSL